MEGLLTFGHKNNLGLQLESEVFKDDIYSNEDLDEGHAQSLLIDNFHENSTKSNREANISVYNPILSPILVTQSAKRISHITQTIHSSVDKKVMEFARFRKFQA